MEQSTTNTSPRYLFVCGCPRSGTTALMHLLNAHRSIALGVERYKKFAKEENINKLDKHVFEKDFFLDIKPGQTNLNPSHKSWDTKWKRVYDSMVPKFSRDDLLIGDKYPHYYMFYDQINQTFDAPKWIFILRDVRDVAMSYNSRAADRKDRWNSDRNYIAAVEDWNISIEKTLEYLASGRDNLFVCEYASLFSYSPDYLAAMLKFLEVALYPDLSNYYRNMTKDWQQRLLKQKKLPIEQEKYVAANARWDLRDTLLTRYGIREVAR